ncbi:ABC transporter permease [Pseudoxanthomonas sacheonensis]|uniref:ABC transporter permease n=1 Tax=Pseudoxanthomonas sacheonensis TaxID=443615 RepID=UPI0013D14871|nr:ABC transporter permease [Pseudoxanthomonas sacheonensis]KAF1710129.1 sugar ABC transporter permease [Pseudoxanthomonas sacheonensis]
MTQPSPSATPVPRFRRFIAHPLFWPLLTLTLLVLGNGLVSPTFLSLHWRDGHLYGNLVDIANRAAPLILVSLGVTLVIAVRGLDISVGAVLAVAATVAAWMIGGESDVSRFPMAVAIAAALSAAALCGLWNGLLVVKLGMQPIVATLILMVAGRGVAQLLADGQILTVYYKPYAYFGNGFLFGLPFSLYVIAAVCLLLWLALGRTALGLFIRAIGGNPVAARLAGVPARWITVGLYVFCAFCAGAAGILVSSNVSSADANNAGQLLELDAILAVTLGGTALGGGRFSLAGSVIGALIIQTLTSTIYSLGVPPQVNLVVKAALVFIVMLLQSVEFRSHVRQLVGQRQAGGDGA